MSTSHLRTSSIDSRPKSRADAVAVHRGPVAHSILPLRACELIMHSLPVANLSRIRREFLELLAAVRLAHNFPHVGLDFEVKLHRLTTSCCLTHKSSSGRPNREREKRQRRLSLLCEHSGTNTQSTQCAPHQCFPKCCWTLFLHSIMYFLD